MRITLATLCLAALVMTTPAPAQTPAPAAPPPPPPDGPIHVLTYFDNNPAWAKQAIAALRAYRDTTTAETGAVRVDLYREISPLSRFVVDETWRDYAAQQAHAATSKLADALKAGAIAPLDIRVQREWSVAARPATTAKAVFGYTHIDVNPPNVAALEAALKPYVDYSRTEKGALNFDVIQCLLPCRNHYTLSEGWASEADFLAHERSAQALEFRRKIAPLLGALYDHRIFKAAK